MAGAALGTAYIKIAPDMTGVQGKVASGFKGVGNQIEDQISKELKNGGSKLSASMSAMMGAVGGIAASAAQSAIGKISSLSSAMIEASDSADKFRQGLGFAGLDTSTIDRLTQQTQEYADATIYDLADIRNATMQLASNGVANYDKLAEAAGNLNAVVGGNADTYKSVTQAMVQTAGAGKLTTENWNQITDAIGGAAGPLQEAMLKAGAYTGNFREALEKGEVSAEEFNNALMELGFDQAAVDAAKSTTTIEGAMGNLEASIVSVGSGIINQFKPMITGAMSGLASGIQSAAGPISNALGTLGGMFNDYIVPAAKDFGSVLGKTVGPILEDMAPIMSNLVDIGMGLVSQVLQVLTGVLQQISEPLQNLTSAVLPMLNQLLDAIYPVLTMIVQVIGTVLGNALAAILPPIQNLLTTVLPPLIQFIQTTLVPWISKIAEVVTNVVNAIIPIVTSAIDTLTSIIQFFIDLFTGNWGKLGEDIAKIWDNLWQTVGNIISGAVNIIANHVSAIWETIKAVFGGMWSGLTQTLSDFWNGVVNFFKGIPGAIGDALSGIFDVGKNLVQGLWNGINDAVGWVLDKIKGFGQSILDGIKGFFGIKSPSRVMANQVGKYISEGLAVGITGSEGVVTKAMQGLEQSALSQFDNMGTQISGTLTAAQSTQPIVTSGQQSPQVVVNQNIEHVGEAIDVTELGYVMGYQASQGVQQVATSNNNLRAGGFAL